MTLAARLGFAVSIRLEGGGLSLNVPYEREAPGTVDPAGDAPEAGSTAMSPVTSA